MTREDRIGRAAPTLANQVLPHPSRRIVNMGLRPIRDGHQARLDTADRLAG